MRRPTMQRGASKYRGEQALSMLEESVARHAREQSDDIYRPWNHATVTRQHNARPWDLIIADAAAGAFEVLLPDPTDPDSIGTQIIVKSSSSAWQWGVFVTVRPVSGTIDGAESTTIGHLESVFVVSDGVEWKVVAGGRKQNNNVQLLSSVYEPVGLWHSHLGAAGGFQDYSGNGNHLSLETGTARYTALTPWMGGFYFDGSTSMYVSTYQAALALTGAMTLQVLCTLTELPSAGQRCLVSHMASGETEATNSLYFLAVGTTGGFFYDHEHGAGINAPLAGYSGGSWLQRHQVGIVGFTRSASGVVQQYLNGRAYDNPTAALTLPTGGTSGRFRVGSIEGSTRWVGVVTSVKLNDRALTPQEMINEYNFSLGRAYGFKTL